MNNHKKNNGIPGEELKGFKKIWEIVKFALKQKELWIFITLLILISMALQYFTDFNLKDFLSLPKKVNSIILLDTVAVLLIAMLWVVRLNRRWEESLQLRISTWVDNSNMKKLDCTLQNKSDVRALSQSLLHNINVSKLPFENNKTEFGNEIIKREDDKQTIIHHFYVIYHLQKQETNACSTKKETNLTSPTKKFIVCRHQASSDWIKKQKTYCGEDITVFEHLDEQAISQMRKNDEVIGILPIKMIHKLNEKGIHFISLDIDSRQDNRGKNLPLEEIEKSNPQLNAYKVTQIK